MFDDEPRKPPENQKRIKGQPKGIQLDFEKSKRISKTKSTAFQGNPTRIERETQGKSNENPMESKNTQRNQKNNPMQIKRKSKESNVNAKKT